MYVWLGMTCAFALTSFGAFYFYQLIFQRTPEWKLVPVKPTSLYGEGWLAMG